MKRTLMFVLALGASLPVAAQAQSFFGNHEEHREGREGGFGGEHREGREGGFGNERREGGFGGEHREGREGGFGGEHHEDHHGRR
ncbi:hypothetical protein [Komagataeibacter sp. FXV3]|uniref:hypothetical protein n=1 Tax=Komagataeibacter sp. FXV3 TaxID=2608998 RepID=UPI00187B7090|nr:hypothetical protein [Komagataeibacter sp. FXV3]MBE7728871.1 hypothetical protein [Komagataeibacter sp. FXV3]